MIRLLVAAEDGLGYRLARHLADECCRAVDWVDPLEDYRTWVEFDGHPWIPLARVKELATRMRIRAWGKFDGRTGAEDAVMMRKLLLVVAGLQLAIDVLVLARDVDHTDRRTGFRQACSELGPHAAFAVVGALAQPEFESWLICGWTPRSDMERKAQADLVRSLGFDPVRHAHQLTSTSAGPRDCKIVLEALAGEVTSAEEHFRTQSRDFLIERGADNGLAAYLLDIEPILRSKLGAGKRS